MSKFKTALRNILLVVLTGFFVSSCKKSDTPNTPSNNNIFPTPISNLAPQSMIDSLRASGSVINSGTTPPIVNGIYLMQTDSCVYDNSAGNYTGTLFADYKFRFSNQVNSTFTISVDQKNLISGILNSTPVYTYISGSGNDFSIFILRTTSPGGITVEQFNVLSGTITSAGIQNFQNTLYMRSKGNDPGNTIVAAGTIRRFVNGGAGIAVTTTSF